MVDGENPLSLAFGHSEFTFSVMSVSPQALLGMNLDDDSGEADDWSDVHAVIFPLAATLSREVGESELAEVAEQLSKTIDLCLSKSIPFVFISDACVFGVDKATPFEELDSCLPTDLYGTWLLSLEALIAEKLEHFLILRTSCLFGIGGMVDTKEVDLFANPNGFIQTVVEHAIERQSLVFDDQSQSSLTAYDDVVRVIRAMLLQLQVGAPRWGIYHYTSSEVTNAHAFAEAIHQALVRYVPDFDASEGLLLSASDSHAAVSDLPEGVSNSAALASHHIANTFGIQQRPWRMYIGGVVEAVVASLAEA